MKTELTDNEIRIAIAEACGWKPWLDYATAGGPEPMWLHPEHQIITSMDDHIAAFTHARTLNGLPSYLTSLDAMHEAEKWLLANRDDKTWLRYVANLQRIAGEMERPPWVKTVVEAFAYAVHAKARQRALAFLATIAP